MQKLELCAVKDDELKAFTESLKSAGKAWFILDAAGGRTIVGHEALPVKPAEPAKAGA